MFFVFCCFCWGLFVLTLAFSGICCYPSRLGLVFTDVDIFLQVDLAVHMMNFDGLDAGMGEYSPSLHGTLDAGLEPSMDPHLNPTLLQGVELDPEALAVTVPESVHLMEGMFSELHSVVSEVGIPVTATHFDLQEEMLWMGNHRVRA